MGRIKRQAHILNRISLFEKIFLLFIGCVAIPLGIQSVFYFKQIENSIQEEMVQKLEAALTDKADKLNGYLSGAVSLCRLYSRQEQLYDCLDCSYKSELDYLTVYQNELKGLFDESIPYYLQVKGMMVYTDNPTVFGGSYIKRLSDMDGEYPVYKVLDDSQQEVNTVALGEEEASMYFSILRKPSRLTSSEDRSMSIFCPLKYYPQYGRYRKILRLDMNLPYMGNVLTENNLFDNMVLADQEGRVLLSVHSYRQYGEFDVFEKEAVLRHAVVIEKKVGDFPLVLYGVYDSKAISDELRKSLYQSLPISLAGLLVATLCLILIAGNITSRIRRVVEQSERIAGGDFVLENYDEDGKDEISILEKSMNRMSERLKNLIENEYQAEVIRAKLEQETTQAKLLALQSQVNPHFMFNALESIRLKAAAKGETETARMIQYMSRMFRKLITWDNSIIPLEDEIRFLDEFLHIQEYRFEDEFSYHIEVRKNAAGCLVPKMMVQQLVENACVHGVEAITNERFVSVFAAVEDGWLVLAVEDNGGGMHPEKLTDIRRMLNGGERKGNSVGLYNVYRRLTLYYGERYRFEIESEPGKGTKCVIRIPASYEQGEEQCIQS